MRRHTKKQGRIGMMGKRGKKKYNVTRNTVRVVPKLKTRKHIPTLHAQEVKFIEAARPSKEIVYKFNDKSKKSLSKGRYTESLGYKMMALVTLLAAYAPTESKFDKGDIGNIGSIVGQDNKTILQWYDNLLEAKKHKRTINKKSKRTINKKSKKRRPS